MTSYVYPVLPSHINNQAETFIPAPRVQFGYLPSIHPKTTASNRSNVEPSPREASIAHCQQKFLLIKCIGAGVYGEAFAAITRPAAEQMLADITIGKNPHILRGDIVVVKFNKSNIRPEDGLQQEMRFLLACLPSGGHPRIMPVLDHCWSGQVQWLAMPFCSGGSLLNFLENHPHALNVSFIWHVGIQLAEAFLYLHFGIEDMSRMQPRCDWPALLHGDVHSGNLLLVPNDTFPYPNVVLADFGLSQKLHSTAGTREKNEFAQSQLHGDIKEIKRLMHSLGLSLMESAGPQSFQERNGLPDQTMAVLLLRFDYLDLPSGQLTDVLPFLRDFLRVASQERERTYQPWLPAIQQSLRGPDFEQDIIRVLRNFNN